jgi:hypothetical protein
VAKKVKEGEKEKQVPADIVLASGKAPFAPDTWHRLKLEFKGTLVTASIDNHAVGSAQNNDCPEGMTGFGSGWHGAQFDNLSIKPATP